MLLSHSGLEVYPEKNIVFVGGIHGVGKTTTCNHFAEKFGWPIYRQRQALIELGSEIGHGWPEVGFQHFRLIRTVAERMLVSIVQSPSPVALFDCHYAIRSARALRLNGRPNGRTFIHDLDVTLVRRLAECHQTHFLLLRADPAVCEQRLLSRHQGAVEEDHSLVALQALAAAEEEHIHQLLHLLEFPDSHAAMCNNANLDSLYVSVEHILHDWGLIS